MIDEQEAVRGRLFTIQDVMQSNIRAWLQVRICLTLSLSWLLFDFMGFLECLGARLIDTNFEFFGSYSVVKFRGNFFCLVEH